MDQSVGRRLSDFLSTVRTRWGPVNFDRRDRFIGTSLSLYSEYAAIEIEFLCRYISPGMHVLDIGANIGTHSVAFESCGAIVDAFEPQSSRCEILRSNLRKGKAHQYALGAETTTRFMTPVDDAGNSGGVALADAGEYKVTVRRLDGLDYDLVDFMKIDVEGEERNVLIGAEKTIKRCRPLLYLENDRLEKSEALLRWLFDHDYHVWWHAPPLYDPNNPCGKTDNFFPNMVSLNVLAIPAENKDAPRPDLTQVLKATDRWEFTSPDNVEARNMTLTASRLVGEGKCETAIAMLRRAIALLPTSPDPWAELGVALHSTGHFDEAVFALNQALQRDPEHNNARSNLALINGILGNYDAAEAVMAELCEIPERRAAERIHLALMLLAKGDWARGMDLYEQRVGVVAKEFKLPKLGVPYWEGEDLDGKILYIQTEQGIGDTIAFSRYISWVAEKYPGATLKLNCHQQYNNMLWEFRHLVDFVPSGVLWPGGDERFDYGIYLHSLARIANARLDCIYPDPGLIRKRVAMQYEAMPLNLPEPNRKGSRKIGLAWTGNPQNATQVRRSVPLELLLYLATDPDSVLYSLQCGVGQSHLDRLRADLLIEDLSETISPDLVITGAAMLELDVVVTCCTSVAHLAGALGVPTFLMLCHDPYWVWGREPHSTPWYPSVRLFRQQTRGDWNSVIRDVYNALKEL